MMIRRRSNGAPTTIGRRSNDDRPTTNDDRPTTNDDQPTTNDDQPTCAVALRQP